jgi:hypothetical protein
LSFANSSGVAGLCSYPFGVSTRIDVRQFSTPLVTIEAQTNTSFPLLEDINVAALGVSLPPEEPAAYPSPNEISPASEIEATDMSKSNAPVFIQNFMVISYAAVATPLCDYFSM